MDIFDKENKKELVKKNIFSSVDAVVLSNILPQRIFSDKYSSDSFSQLYEKAPGKNIFGEYIDCETSFKAGENYSKLKQKKHIVQLKYDFLRVKRFFIGSKRYQTSHKRLVKEFEDITSTIDESKKYFGSMSFQFGKEKSKIDFHEKLILYFVTAGAIGATLLELYSQTK